MDKFHYDEMLSGLEKLEMEGRIQGKKIYLFGHCSATEELAELLRSKEYHVVAILDNNKYKHGNFFKDIEIVPPQYILSEPPELTIVCIVARANAAMQVQLKNLGYKGEIKKLIDYNSYANYSLSNESIALMKDRANRGRVNLDSLSKKYFGYFKILCPFNALGDIYIMMSYLPHYLKKINVSKCMIGVIGNACGQVAELYFRNYEVGKTNSAIDLLEYKVEVLSQKIMDETIQAALYIQDKNTYIPHQDRPYIINLSKALYIKKISLDQIYCCGVFGLPFDIEPVKPLAFKPYSKLDDIQDGNAVILSPYAKSVTALPVYVWKQIVNYYKSKGKICYTNVVNEEVPLLGTEAISPSISEMKSVVEKAGIFVGIRSGLCDVLRTAAAEKIALYPDYNYSNTQWKAIDVYKLAGWENIVIKDGFKWEKN